MWLRRSNQPVADVPPCAVDRYDLRVLTEGIVDLAIAGSDHAFDRRDVEQRFIRECVHSSDQVVEPALDNKISASLHECRDRWRHAAADAPEHLSPTLVRDVGVLLRARQRKLFLDDLASEHEPRVVVSGSTEMRERPERVEAWEEWYRKPIAARVEPDGRWTRKNANPVIAPDRTPVPYSFRVMPHPIAIDHASAGPLGD